MKLQLTLQLLANELNKYHSDITVRTNTRTNVKKAALFSADTSFNNINCLYCGTITEPFKNLLEDTCFLFTKEPPKEFGIKNYIVVPTDSPVQLVYIQVQEILIQIWSWYAQVLEVSSAGTDFHALLSASASLFNGTFYFHSIYHNCFFHDGEENTDASYWENIIKTYYEPDAPISVFTPDIMTNNHSQRTPLLITNPLTKEPFLSCNVFFENIRMGSFVVFPEKMQMKDNYSIYLQVLSSCAISMFGRILREPELSLQRALKQLLSGECVTSKTLSSLCQKENWMAKDSTFRVLVICPLPSSKKTFFIEQLLYQNIISTICGKSKIIFFEESIVVIRDLTDDKESCTDTALFDKLLFFIKKIHATIGISIPFSNLEQIRTFYEQARTIACNQTIPLSVHNGQDSAHRHTAVLHEYSYYLLYDIVHNFSGTRALKHYIHPDVMKLTEYDKDGKNHLLISLYYYLLNDRSYQDCADKLYIHRNTFAYRIKKALSIVTDDLSDENVRLSILLSICMYWYLNPEIDPIGISSWNKK